MRKTAEKTPKIIRTIKYFPLIWVKKRLLPFRRRSTITPSQQGCLPAAGLPISPSVQYGKQACLFRLRLNTASRPAYFAFGSIRQAGLPISPSAQYGKQACLFRLRLNTASRPAYFAFGSIRQACRAIGVADTRGLRGYVLAGAASIRRAF